MFSDLFFFPQCVPSSAFYLLLPHGEYKQKKRGKKIILSKESSELRKFSLENY